METVSRTSTDSGHQSDTTLLWGSEKSPKFLTDRTAKRRISWAIFVPWALCVMLLAGILAQTTALAKSSRRSHEYWKPFELEIAQREAPKTTKQIQFTGAIFYNESKGLNRRLPRDGPDYVGFPSEEIDAAWNELLVPLDIYLTPEEVKENIENDGAFADIPDDVPPHIDPLTGLYQAVPSVFHDMHCVNKIRQALYVDYYQQERNNIFWVHIQHCLDAIRQSIMCASDMTPVIEAHTDLKPRGNLLPVVEVHHTCRDYKDMQAWARTRDVSDEVVWRKNVEKNHPGFFDDH